MIAWFIQPLMLNFPRKNFHRKIPSGAEQTDGGWGLGVGVKKQLKVDKQGEGLQ